MEVHPWPCPVSACLGRDRDGNERAWKNPEAGRIRSDSNLDMKEEVPALALMPPAWAITLVWATTVAAADNAYDDENNDASRCQLP